MPKQPVVLCVDLLPLAMRELMTAQTPQGLTLVCVETFNEGERVMKAREADYILCSWTPISGRVIEADRVAA